MIVETYRPGDFVAFLRTAQRRLRTYLDAPPDIYPWPCEHCSRCDYIPVCAKRWEDDDHLTLVASIRRDQVEKLNGVGVQTLAGLGGVAGRPPRPPRRAADARRACATRPVSSSTAAAPDELTRRLLEPENERGLGLLPPPSPGDLFFDMEGDPFFEPAGGLEFLFGVLCRRPDGTNDVHRHPGPRPGRGAEGLRASSSTSSTRACAEHPDMHVYHYAAYEPSTLARLMGAHATREAEVDDLLRREVLVDLLQVVRQGLRAGVPSYSLKDIEQFFFTRHADVKSGNDAVISFERYLENGDEALLADIEAYNEEDCLATLELRDWLLVQREQAEAEFGVEIPFRTPPGQREQPPESAEADEATARLREALLANAEHGDERWLMAQLLDYHRREARPGWWWYFRRFEMTDEELIEDAEAIAGLEWDGAEPTVVVRTRSSTRFTFPPQQHRFDPDDSGEGPRRGRNELERGRCGQRTGHRASEAWQGVAREALADGARPRRAVRHPLASRRASPHGRVDARRGRPLPARSGASSAAIVRSAARRSSGWIWTISGRSRSLSTARTSSSRDRPGQARRIAAPGSSPRSSGPGSASASPPRATRRSTTCSTRSSARPPRRA